MRTTLDIPDPLFRQMKAFSALQGQSLKEFITDAIKKVLEKPLSRPKVKGWKAFAGCMSQKEARDVQKIIDEEFSKINPEEWQ